MGRNGRRVIAVLAIAGLGLTLTACGDDDDDTPAAAEDGSDTAEAEDTASDTAEAEDSETAEPEDSDTAEAEESDDEGSIQVDDLNDIPDECLDIFKDFLKEIEPVVEDVDWENADLSAMEDIGEQLDSVASGMDDKMADAGADCDKYELSDDTDMDTLIDLAKEEAPGTVAYFEFIKQLQEGFSDMTIPDVSMPDVTMPDVTMPESTGSAADLPTDCEGAIDYIHDLMDQYDSMMDMPVSNMSTIGTVTQTLTSTCTVNQMSDFYNDPDVTAWMSGT